jgi:hypothetical protein
MHTLYFRSAGDIYAFFELIILINSSRISCTWNLISHKFVLCGIIISLDSRIVNTKNPQFLARGMFQLYFIATRRIAVTTIIAGIEAKVKLTPNESMIKSTITPRKLAEA